MSPLLPLKLGEVATPETHNGAQGTVRSACTRTGRRVRVWVPDAGNVHALTHFCHGHSLGTHAVHGYSVFSGRDLQAVLQDEYLLVGSLHNALAGDIVVWYGQGDVAADRHAIHSALVTATPPMLGNGRADLLNTKLSSKDGMHPLNTEATLGSLVLRYGKNYAVFRRRP